MSKLAVVFGGSGFVGRNLVRELAKRGWRVRVAVRRPHLAQFLRPMGDVGQIQLKQTNVRHRGSVEEAVNGADAVINLVGILHQCGAQRFDSIQSRSAGVIADASKRAGVSDFIHISAIGSNLDSDSIYARTKAEGEEAVRSAFPDAVIVRPSIIFGPGDNFFNRFAAMATLSPLVPLPLIGGGLTKFQPIYVDDIADAICAALVSPSAKGAIFELGGPRTYTFRELMELIVNETGRKRLLAPVPFSVAGMIGLAGEIFGLLPIFDPPLTRDQVRLLKSDNVVSDDSSIKTIADLGVAPRTVESIVPSYLVRYRKYGQFAEQPA